MISKKNSAIRPGKKFLVGTAIILCASLVLAQTHSPTASDTVRSVPEMTAMSTHIAEVMASEAKTGSCGYSEAKGLVLYKGRVLRSFMGGKSIGEIEFCGYSGLTLNTRYIIFFDQKKIGGRSFFSPDGVFIERLPDDYYRLLSYESDRYEVEGKTAMVLGFRYPGLVENIEESVRKK